MPLPANMPYWNARLALPRTVTTITCAQLERAPVHTYHYDSLVWLASISKNTEDRAHHIIWVARMFGKDVCEVVDDVARVHHGAPHP